MSGIIFNKTKNLAVIVEFYTKKLGMSVWLDQADCAVLKHGNLLLGFCAREEIDDQGMITLFYESQSDVDLMYENLKKTALDLPRQNDKYKIYQFFARDPENRMLEFQTFLHPVAPFFAGDELLEIRRSIRKFKDTPIQDDVLWKLFEVCRHSPTSMNRPSYYFVVIRDRQKIQKLSEERGRATAPIGAASLAVAICSDPSKTKRTYEDGHIAAYHFLLAAKSFQLGTCWIADMNRPKVKKLLDIPEDHYVATITPLGYPAEQPAIPQRRAANEMVRFIE